MTLLARLCLLVKNLKEESEDFPSSLNTLLFDPNLELFGLELHLNRAEGLGDVKNSEQLLEPLLLLCVPLDELSYLFL